MATDADDGPPATDAPGAFGTVVSLVGYRFLFGAGLRPLAARSATTR